MRPPRRVRPSRVGPGGPPTTPSHTALADRNISDAAPRSPPIDSPDAACPLSPAPAGPRTFSARVRASQPALRPAKAAPLPEQWEPVTRCFEPRLARFAFRLFRSSQSQKSPLVGIELSEVRWQSTSPPALPPTLPVRLGELSRHGFFIGMHQIVRLGFEDKLGITELAHFRQVQSRHFRFNRHPVSDEELDHQVDQEAEGEDEPDQRGDADQLRR